MHSVYAFPSWLMEPGYSWLGKGFVNCCCDVLDGTSRWSEIFTESIQAINNALRQPFIIPSPILSYWYADVSWMSLTEPGNCLVTHNSIKTYYKYSSKNIICSLCQHIWPKFWDMFRSQKMYGFCWFSSRHDWYAIPWDPAEYFRIKIMNQQRQCKALYKGYIPYC